ncbi:hypothetical protein AZI86_11070 [Bdellovibrio bacteriovorus]|uniref:Phosphoglycerate dehydrogenase n=1 Tax=Bdellovibrio bacteriovorus TaxID=959 RepID=A0A150WL61_BDEBC|nr:phosphoglycerate dehydrogenase [Bdellovibrio bacteriovorus]KYG64741.1 hypothetical protein AZI86_11070 [Bdellovibrio bacteriovorus]
MSDVVAVASRSFSSDSFLRDSLLALYPKARFNESGKSLSGKELVDFLKGAPKAIIALEKVNQELVNQLPDLKLISKYGVGLDNIDFTALEKNNVRLSWTGGVNRRSVAELTLHFILGTVRGSFHSHHDLQNNHWFQFKGYNLSGKTVGIVGLGHVGKELVPFLKPFGVKILAYDLKERSGYCQENAITQVSNLEDLLSNSDVITIHVPHTSLTHMFFDEKRMAKIKKGSFLVNTARGGIVDETALFEMLKSGHIASAAFDVFDNEPLADENLMSLRNFYFTPHIGGSSVESIRAMGLAAIEGLSTGKIARPENFFDYPL